MAKLRVRGPSWVLDWSDATGQHRKVIGKTAFMTKREAESIRLAKELELASGVQVMRGLSTRRDVPTLKQYATRYLDWYELSQPDTFDDVRRRVYKQIVPALGHYPLDGIPLFEAEQWKLKRGTEVMPSTANLEVRTLRAMLNKAVEWGDIDRSPLPQVRFPDLPDPRDVAPKYLTKEQLGALYEAAREGGYAPVWKLLANTGMRRNEALGLRWTQVSDSQITIESRLNERTKTRKSRAIPLNTAAREALAVLKLRASTNAWVLPRASSDNLTHRFLKHRRKAGLPGEITLHSLRHTFASHLVMAGVPLRTVQVLMGHSRIEMTEIYAALAPGHLEDHVNRINL